MSADGNRASAMGSGALTFRWRFFSGGLERSAWRGRFAAAASAAPAAAAAARPARSAGLVIIAGLLGGRRGLPLALLFRGLEWPAWRGRFAAGASAAAICGPSSSLDSSDDDDILGGASTSHTKRKTLILCVSVVKA